MAAANVQASMPMVVFVVGVGFATEKFTTRVALNMVVVGTGIAIASYGEPAYCVPEILRWLWGMPSTEPCP